MRIFKKISKNSKNFQKEFVAKTVKKKEPTLRTLTECLTRDSKRTEQNTMISPPTGPMVD